MKKIYFSACLLASLGLNAQVFSEDFATGIPSTWTVLDLDGGTPNTSQNNLQTAGWHGASERAANTGWYATPAQSNDWLISPQIELPAIASGGYALTYDVLSPDGNYPNNYEILVSTTGTSVADFTSIVAETPTSTETRKSVLLSAYAGQSIYIAFRDVSNDKFVLYFDNVQVIEVNAVDVKLQTVSFNRFVEVPTTQSLQLEVVNNGITALTSYDVSWSYGGNNYTHTVSNINLAFNEMHTLTTDVDVTVDQADEVAFSVSVSVSGDADATNNGGSAAINGMSEIPTKHVVMEEATGTWCGWCPRGAVGLDAIAAEGEEVVAIAVHNGDPMANADHDGNMNVSGYPSANGDRNLRGFNPSADGFANAYNVLKDIISPVEVDITAVMNNGVVDVTASATFRTTISEGSYNISVVAIEDWVSSTAAGYAQANYYSGGQSGVMGGYEVLANPVPAADMVYRHVSRGFINPGGFAGDQTVIPNTITADQEYSVTYNYTIPSTIREGLLGFAAIVTDKETGVILNAAQVHGIENVVGVEEFSSNFSITPNPTNDVFTLNTSVEGEATVQIINSLGQVVATYNNNLEANATYDVSAYEAGVYFVNVTVGNQVATQRLVIE